MSEGADKLPFQTTTEIRRRAYQSPRLSMLGDVVNLTETGSMNEQEDGSLNGACPLMATTNTTGNMC